jgi:hypothetical protein
MKPKYKLIVGPTQMRVERQLFKSEPIDIGDEYITADNQKAKDFYYEFMHPSVQEYARLLWTTKSIRWNTLKQQVKGLADMHTILYFDGPSWIVSTVPWKQAKYEEWFVVPMKVKWLLKKFYFEKVEKV